MSVTLDPPELGFRRPFTHEVTQMLRLRNPSSEPIAFKVKTTAPKQCVPIPSTGRPAIKTLIGIAFGLIQGALKLVARLKYKAMREDPPPDARCRDKFLVQSVAISPDREVGSVTAIWQNIEKIAKGTIEERKIRVVFLPAEVSSSTPQHNNINGTHLANEAPPAYASPSPSYGSPEAVTPNVRSIAPDSGPTTNSKNLGHSLSNAAASAQSSLSAATSSVANAIPTSGDDLRAQLDQAKATISKLTQQSEEQGLRQRKTEAVNQDARERITTGTTGMGVQQQPADGVPVQIVAALCLLSFLLAYFLF